MGKGGVCVSGEKQPQRGCAGRDGEGPGEVSMRLLIRLSSTRLSSCHHLPSSVRSINRRLDFLTSAALALQGVEMNVFNQTSN